jgi:hypothetical protein
MWTLSLMGIRCIEECRINIQLAHLEVHGNNIGHEEPEAGHLDHKVERYRVIEANSLAITLGNKARLVA